MTVAARADTVKLTGRPAFEQVSVRDFRPDRVVFRGASGQYLRKPLAEIEWLNIDGEADLNAAERARATGDWAVAAARYADVAAARDRPWLIDLALFRLLEVWERAGRFDRAVETYVRLAGRVPEAAATYAPSRPAPPGSEENRRAIAALQAALEAELLPAAAQLLRVLLLELALYEDLPDLPAPPRWEENVAGGGPPVRGGPSGPYPATVPTSQPVSDGGAAPVGEPAVGILPGLVDAPASAPAAMPALGPRSLVLAAVRAASEGGDYRRAARLAERAMPYVPPRDRAPWRLEWGRARLETGAAAAAAADLLALAERDQDGARAALALYYAGLAHERLGRGDVARRLYQEVLSRAASDPATAALARAGLERLPP